MEQEILKLILVEMREMKGDMSEVKGKLTNLETDMTEVKGRLTNLETDMAEVKSDMTEVKGRLTSLETDMTEVKKDVTDIKGRLKRVEELSEFNYDTCQTIMKVCEEHFKEFKQFIKKNNEDHQRYNSKILNYRVEESDE